MDLIRKFVSRHNGPRQKDVEKMLNLVGAGSLNEDFNFAVQRQKGNF